MVRKKNERKALDKQGLHHSAMRLATQPDMAPTTRKMRAKDRPLVNDFVSDAEFDTLLDGWFGNIARALLPGHGFYIWGGYANLSNYPPMLKKHGLYFSQCIVWNKCHPVPLSNPRVKKVLEFRRGTVRFACHALQAAFAAFVTLIQFPKKYRLRLSLSWFRPLFYGVFVVRGVIRCVVFYVDTLPLNPVKPSEHSRLFGNFLRFIKIVFGRCQTFPKVSQTP